MSSASSTLERRVDDVSRLNEALEKQLPQRVVFDDQVRPLVEIIREFRTEFPKFSEKLLKIYDKSGNIVPLKLNKAQLELHRRAEDMLAETGRVRLLVLKGRQQGISTYIQGRFYWKVSLWKGKRAYVLAHEQQASNNLYDMAQRFYEEMPEVLKPKLGSANAKEMTFDRLDSGYKVSTAGSKGVGRSATVQLFHGSECAYWPNSSSHFAGLGQAIPDLEGTEVFLESTSAGPAGEFYNRVQMALRGEGEYRIVFLPWYWQDEYRRAVPQGFRPTVEETEIMQAHDMDLEQIVWRRNKIESDFGGDFKRFAREYPMTITEAFLAGRDDTVIRIEDVEAAKRAKVQSIGPLVVGVDPARYGQDRTAICWRKGRQTQKLRTYTQQSTMAVAGIVAQIIERESPRQVFIDIGGLGAGIYDRLVELGYKGVVTGVDSGTKAQEPDRYVNRRAEMWGRMRDWLQSPPVQIPADDELSADLLCPRNTFDSHGRMKLESKEDIRKDPDRRSPDLADALALTFADVVRDRRPKGRAVEYNPLDEWVNW